MEDRVRWTNITLNIVPEEEEETDKIAEGIIAKNVQKPEERHVPTDSQTE